MRTLTRNHYSAWPVRKAQLRSVGADEQLMDGPKPIGFWYSVDGNGDGWPEWCRTDDFNLDCFDYRNELDIDPRAIKVIRSIRELDQFHKYFHATPPSHPVNVNYINWKLVSNNFDGIEIAPYLWGRRRRGNASEWYVDWDVASGCIWRIRAIRSITTTKFSLSCPTSEAAA